MVRKTNVLLLLPALTRAGAQTQSILLANTMNNDLFNVFMASFNPSQDLRGTIDDKSVHYIKLEKRYKIDLGLAKRIARLIEEREIDVVYACMQYPFFYVFLARLFSRRKFKVVVSIHTTVNISSKEEFADRFLYQHLLRTADKIIFVCKNQMDYWIQKFPSLEGLSTFVHNGVDEEQYSTNRFLAARQNIREAYAIKEEEVVFSCIAGFRPEKNHLGLIRAFSKLPPDGRLLLAGEGETKKRCESLVDEYNLKGRVEFLGLLSDVRPLLAASNASILSSTAVETFSIAMLESMAMKTPCIMTDIGGANEAVENGVNGILIPAKEEGHLLAALDACLKDPAKFKVMGERARETVLRKFTASTMTKQVEQVILDVLES